MSEQEVLKACINYLRWRGHYCQRVHSGLIRQVIGKEVRWIHLADRGTPDILACIDGKFVGIEVKASEAAKKEWHRKVKKSLELKPLVKNDETAVAQHEQMNLIESAGGYTALISSIAELEHMITIITTNESKPSLKRLKTPLD